MEVRRVQKFGKSTLMVSLPADWVKEVGLSAGETIYIDTDEDGSLKIYPPTTRMASTTKEIKIIVSNNVQADIVSRVIQSLYSLGFDKIDIQSKDGVLSEDILRKAKETVRNLIGLEVVNQTLDELQIQSFLDPTKYSMNSLISRISSSLKQMLHYLSLGIKEGSRTFLQEVVELEKEVDRLYALAVRQLILAQTNRSLAYMIGVKRIQIVGNRILIKSIEEAADEINEAAEDLLALSPSELEYIKLAWDSLNMIIEQTSVVIDHVIKALTKTDVKLANEVLEELRTLRRVLVSQTSNLESKLAESKEPKIITTLRILNLRLYNTIRRMEPIAEISLNRSIENLKELIID